MYDQLNKLNRSQFRFELPSLRTIQFLFAWLYLKLFKTKFYILVILSKYSLLFIINRCISDSLECDGDKNCGDQSDESSCSITSSAPSTENTTDQSASSTTDTPSASSSPATSSQSAASSSQSPASTSQSPISLPASAVTVLTSYKIHGNILFWTVTCKDRFILCHLVHYVYWKVRKTR